VTTSLLPPEGEHLTDGWEPDCPAHDTLVRQAVLVHASWAVELARRAGRPWHRGGHWAGGHVGDRGMITNWVVLLRPPTDGAGLVDSIGQLFPPEVPYLLVSAWPTPDLEPHGLVLVGHPPLMLRLPGPVAGGAPRTDLEVREVTTADELAAMERVLVDGYPIPELQPVQPGQLYDVRLLEGPTRAWLAWDSGTPVACSMAHSAAGMTLVECVAVLPRARGHGAGAAVTWAATASEPEQAAVLIASDDGQPVYQRLGYLRLERWTVWGAPGA
jgi:hypothetical protein